eukprot:Skav221722  [mRNA]  locus=scaffold542:274971:284023:- [translate_table: standard]
MCQKPEDEHEENCTRFIYGNGLEDVLLKSKSIVKLLQASAKDWEEPNTAKDDRYLLFLMAPLNLIFFFAASCIARWYERFRLKAAAWLKTVMGNPGPQLI